MANNKPIKKTVSFEQGITNGSLGDQSSSESKQSSKSTNNVVPQLQNNLLVVPFHNILILIGMFYMGLTSDVEGVMLRGFLTNIPIQIIYNYIIYSNLAKKSKDRKSVV